MDWVQRKRPSADDYSGVDFDGPSKRARGKAAVEMLDNDSGGEDSDGEDIDATKVFCCCHSFVVDFIAAFKLSPFA